MTIDNLYFYIFFKFVIGIGFFLYGIYLMSDTLKKITGDKLKQLISKYTNNPIKGLLVGILSTALLQSSSGTTAITISFVRAGLMSFPQSIAIIMGANIGTTVTAFLIGINIADYSHFILFCGAFIFLTMNNHKIKLYGLALFGFGILFYGINLMGDQLTYLSNYTHASNLMLRFTNEPLLGVMIGTCITALIQSSSASTAIVQQLYDKQLITLRGALPILIGNNVGTTITAIIASIGGSITAKRTSLFHVFFNVFGAILFLLILSPYHDLIIYITNKTHATKEMTIAYSHIIFNFTIAFILIWFIKEIVWVIRKIIPD